LALLKVLLVVDGSCSLQLVVVRLSSMDFAQNESSSFVPVRVFAQPEELYVTQALRK
jgi:hypothetical protein